MKAQWVYEGAYLTLLLGEGLGPSPSRKSDHCRPLGLLCSCACA